MTELPIDRFSNKVVDFSAAEKARLSALLCLLAEKLTKDGDENLTEEQFETVIESTDHFLHRLLGRRNSEHLPKEVKV